MKVLRGEWAGKTGRVTQTLLSGPCVFVAREKFKLPADFKTVKALSVDDRRSTAQNFILLVLALTLIGIPIAILLALVWRPLNATVGFRLQSGQEFVGQLNKAEYMTLKPFLGITDSF